MATAMENRMTPGRLIAFSLLGLWLIIAAFPSLTFGGSFKVQADFFSKADWTNALWGTNTIRETGGAFTSQGYAGAWITEEFWRNVINSGIVVFFTVVISLTFGTLGGYALARSVSLRVLASDGRTRFPRDAAHHVGVRLPAAFFRVEYLGAPADHNHRIGGNQSAVHTVDAALFFLNIPKDMDESAMVDECRGFGRYVIVPVMWPGVITTGLFSFLLAYNDFTVTAMLLSAENETIIPAINSFLRTTQVEGKVMYAVASTA